MPQEHYVLRCFSCETFQAHIVKKAKKWECKICGAKQSVKRNYGKGSGKDCRNQVMKLNELRFINGCSSNEVDGNNFEDDNFEFQEVEEQSKQKKPFTSKWVDFLDTPDPNEESEDDCATDLCLIVEEKTKKRVRKTDKNNYSGNKKICKDLTKSGTSPPKNQLSPINHNKLDSYKTNEKPTIKNKPIQIKTSTKVSKYDKYIDNEEEKEEQNEENLTKSNKYSNIFDSDPEDLDNILNL